MRKNISFAIAAAVMGLAMVFWVRSGVVASSADVRGKATGLLYFEPSGAYLPFRVAEPVW
jgi:hypothetical protein